MPLSLLMPAPMTGRSFRLQLFSSIVCTLTLWRFLSFVTRWWLSVGVDAKTLAALGRRTDARLTHVVASAAAWLATFLVFLDLLRAVARLQRLVAN